MVETDGTPKTLASFRLSKPMRRMLLSLRDGKQADDGLRTKAQFCAIGCVLRSLWARGLLDGETLTPLGREVAELIATADA